MSVQSLKGVTGRTLKRQVYTRTSGDYTTSGTTMQNIDGTNLVFTLDLPEPARVRMTQVCHILGGATANQQGWMDAAVDGTRVGGTTDSEGLIAFRNANDTTQRRYNGSYSYTTDVLAAGSHTFAFMWSVGSGTATVGATGKPRWVVEEIPETTGGLRGPAGPAVRSASLKYTAGDITASANAVWADLGIGDLTIAAASGDWVEVGISLTSTNSTAVSVNFDVVSIVSASPVNSFASGATPSDSNDGISGWRISSSAPSNVGGSILYQLQAGDITGGTVVARVRVRPASSTDRVIDATTARPIHFWIKNLGQN